MAAQTSSRSAKRKRDMGTPASSKSRFISGARSYQLRMLLSPITTVKLAAFVLTFYSCEDIRTRRVPAVGASVPEGARDELDAGIRPAGALVALDAGCGAADHRAVHAARGAESEAALV